MEMYILSNNVFLDNYVLNKEFSLKAGIAPNSYRYWKNCKAAKYDGSRTIFLNKSYIIKKYEHIIEQCTSLKGYVQSQAFCNFTGLAPSHLIEKNNSTMYNLLDIVNVEGVKFVNLKKFYDELELDYKYNLYIEKCNRFAPSPLEKRIKLTESLCLGYY